MPSEVSGRIVAPPSKSVAQRAIALAAMTRGESLLRNVGQSDDVRAAIGIAQALGARLQMAGDGALRVCGGELLRGGTLCCGESGLALRMFAPIAAAAGGEWRINACGTLLQRPIAPLADALRSLGVEVDTSAPPLVLRGLMRGGAIRIDGRHGSQVMSGLLMAAPYTQQSLTIHVDTLNSRPYVYLTIDMMQQFGVQVDISDSGRQFGVMAGQHYAPCNIDVEGDWSGAAFVLCAAAIAGWVRVDGLREQSLQPDRAVLDVLRRVGAMVESVRGGIAVQRDELRSFTFDATHCPDLIPPLAALAAHCDGCSCISGVSRLRTKESDRAAALVHEFGLMGINIGIDGDSLFVHGGAPRAATLHSHADHRMAMACAVAALQASGTVVIEGAEAVRKSYPEFWMHLEQLQRGSSV